jgi:hypothetical protein
MIAKRCFGSPQGWWGATLTVTVLLTLSVAGTWLYLADQYLHPRTLATALLLFALASFLDNHWWLTGFWLLLAATIHIQMTFFGVLLLAFLLLKPRTPEMPLGIMLGLFPLATLFGRSNAGWREAMLPRRAHFLPRWEWYEWLGIFGAWVVLYGIAWVSRRSAAKMYRGENIPVVIRQNMVRPLMRAWISRRLFWFGIFIFFSAAVTTLPPRFERLTPYQPMRGCHLLYLLMFLFLGGVIAELLLQKRVWRWMALFVPLSLGMFLAQRSLFPGTEHVEWPDRPSRNTWLQAFDWVKRNTPVDAYFALDPRYMARSGEDQHGFRSLAERSQMADWVKDPGVVSLFPAIGPQWQKQVHTLDGWERFQAEDFFRLRRKFGVNWIVIDRQVAGLPCPYHNTAIWVCHVDGRAAKLDESVHGDGTQASKVGRRALAARACRHCPGNDARA